MSRQEKHPATASNQEQAQASRQEQKQAQPEAEAPADRRPLASRSTRWAVSLSQHLAATEITPNQISYCSVVAALLALPLLMATGHLGSSSWISLCLLLAAVMCQLRLLCNLMDGMVAIEAGKQTRDGAVWNELPDRIADVLFLVGAGMAAGFISLGWAAAALAVSTAYVRELGKGIDGVVDFAGPMAKPHRMALLTLALLLAAIVNLFADPLLYQQILEWALWLLCAGCIVTLYRRSSALLQRLQ